MKQIDCSQLRKLVEWCQWEGWIIISCWCCRLDDRPSSSGQFRLASSHLTGQCVCLPASTRHFHHAVQTLLNCDSARENYNGLLDEVKKYTEKQSTIFNSNNHITLSIRADCLFWCRIFIKLLFAVCITANLKRRSLKKKVHFCIMLHFFKICETNNSWQCAGSHYDYTWITRES